MQYDYERAAAIINAFRDLVMEIKSIGQIYTSFKTSS